MWLVYSSSKLIFRWRSPVVHNRHTCMSCSDVAGLNTTITTEIHFYYHAFHPTFTQVGIMTKLLKGFCPVKQHDAAFQRQLFSLWTAALRS